MVWLGSHSEQRIRMSLNSLQIDNQMPDAISSVLFLDCSAKMKASPLASASKKTLRSKGARGSGRKLLWLEFQLDV